MTFSVTDGALADSEVVTITIADVNLPPVITSKPVTVAKANTPYVYDVQARSQDGDPLTFALATAPAGMTINPATGLISWPAAIHAPVNPFGSTPGTHVPTAGKVLVPVTVTATDGKHASDTQSFVITVTP